MLSRSEGKPIRVNQDARRGDRSLNRQRGTGGAAEGAVWLLLGESELFLQTEDYGCAEDLLAPRRLRFGGLPDGERPGSPAQVRGSRQRAHLQLLAGERRSSLPAGARSEEVFRREGARLGEGAKEEGLRALGRRGSGSVGSAHPGLPTGF